MTSKLNNLSDEQLEFLLSSYNEEDLKKVLPFLEEEDLSDSPCEPLLRKALDSDTVVGFFDMNDIKRGIFKVSLEELYKIYLITYNGRKAERLFFKNLAISKFLSAETAKDTYIFISKPLDSIYLKAGITFGIRIKRTDLFAETGTRRRKAIAFLRTYCLADGKVEVNSILFYVFYMKHYKTFSPEGLMLSYNAFLRSMRFIIPHKLKDKHRSMFFLNRELARFLTEEEQIKTAVEYSKKIFSKIGIQTLQQEVRHETKGQWRKKTGAFWKTRKNKVSRSTSGTGTEE